MYESRLFFRHSEFKWGHKKVACTRRGRTPIRSFSTDCSAGNHAGFPHPCISQRKNNFLSRSQTYPPPHRNPSSRMFLTRRSQCSTNHHLKVAVLGSAIASVACLLKKQGHLPTVFESVSDPKPMGAGFLLQPGGTSILENCIGIDLVSHNTKIHRLLGQDHLGFDSTVLDIQYKYLKPGGQFGVGVKREFLFSSLHAKMRELEVPLHSGVQINEVRGLQCGKALVKAENWDDQTEYDLVLVCTGTFPPLPKFFNSDSQSPIDLSLSNKRTFKPYPFGALWTKFQVDTSKMGYFSNLINTGLLYNQYCGSKYMLGYLPCGNDNITMFWSIDRRLPHPIDEMTTTEFFDFISTKCPTSEHARPYVLEMEKQGLKPFAVGRYADLTMSTYHIPANFSKTPIVFLGDAAHSSSPQLGQGANHALMDAYYLSRLLGNFDQHVSEGCEVRGFDQHAQSLIDKIRKSGNTDIFSRIQLYSQVHKPTLQYYQMASMFLTPVFQSNSRIVSVLRKTAAPPLHFIPPIYSEALNSLAGRKVGFFSSL